MEKIDVLPKFILLKLDANNKYLRFRSSNEEKGSNNSFLHFSHVLEDPTVQLSAPPEKPDQFPDTEKLDQFLDSEKPNQLLESEKPYHLPESEKIEFHFLKFEVEKAKTVEGFVHIRTCYNNKYWVRKSEDENWIVAEANEPEEDQSKWNCTLFKPIFLDADGDADVSTTNERKIRLLHVGQHHVGISSRTMQDESHLVVGQESNNLDSGAVFTFTDATPIAILPEYVAFMGHTGKYLAPSGNYLRFGASHIGERGVTQRIVYNSSRREIWIYDNATGYRWCCVFGPMIMPMPENYPHSLFSPIRIGSHIALKWTYFGTFADSRSSSNGPDILIADVSTITNTTILRVAEPVLSREIIDATYHLNDSRIYGVSNVEKYSDSRSNNTSIEQTGTFEVEYKASHTMSWNQNVTVSIGVSVSWSFGFPKIGEFGIEVSYERGETWEWGEEKTEEKTIKYTQTITIPPRRKVTLKVVAMKAYCDVPFSCKVNDLMTDGTHRTYTKNDGLFVGCNEFQFNTLLMEEDL